MSDSVCCTSGADFFCMLNDHGFEVHVVTATCPPIQYPQHCGIFHFGMVPMIHTMVFCLFAFVYINADDMCTCIKVAMLSSTLEQRSCLQLACVTAALVLWINGDWNLTEMQEIANETTALPALKILPSEYCDDINILMPVWCVRSTQVTQKFSLCSGKCSLSLCKDCARGVGVLSRSLHRYRPKHS